MLKWFPVICLTFTYFTNIVYAEGLKIAVIDLEKAIGAAEAVKAITLQLDTEFEKERKELKDLQKKIAKLEEKQKQKPETMDQEQADKLESEVRRRRVQYGYFFEAVSEKADERHEELMESINPLIKQAMKEVIELSGYDMVYQQESLLHFDTKFDISEKLTQKINELTGKASK